MLIGFAIVDITIAQVIIMQDYINVIAYDNEIESSNPPPLTENILMGGIDFLSRTEVLIVELSQNALMVTMYN